MKYAGKEYPEIIVTMIDSALEYINGASHLSSDEANGLIDDWINEAFGPEGDRDCYPLESESDRQTAIEAAQEIYADASDSAEPYYWLDTNYPYGDYSVLKFALIRGYRDEYGEKDRSTEEVIVWGEYDDLNLENHSKDEDCYDEIDAFIKEKIGFVPDYEVN